MKALLIARGSGILDFRDEILGHGCNFEVFGFEVVNEGGVDVWVYGVGPTPGMRTVREVIVLVFFRGLD